MSIHVFGYMQCDQCGNRMVTEGPFHWTVLDNQYLLDSMTYPSGWITQGGYGTLRRHFCSMKCVEKQKNTCYSK